MSGYLVAAIAILQYDLVNWLNKFLLPGFAQDDIVLEVIMVIGVIATDPSCAPMIANSRLISGLQQLLDYQKEDDEMVLQVGAVCLLRMFLPNMWPRNAIAAGVHILLPRAGTGNTRCYPGFGGSRFHHRAHDRYAAR